MTETIELYVITDNENKLIAIYTDKKRAITFVKPSQTVEFWMKNYDDGFEYVEDVNND